MELAAALHHSRDWGRVTNNGPRAPKTASSGARPEPQGQERGARRPTGLLSPPARVAGAKEGGGAEEEFGGKGAVARCAVCSPDAGAEAHSRSSQLERRRRKKGRKKRKKKLPWRALPRHGCRRPCDHQRRVPAVSPQTLGIPVVTQRQVPTAHLFMLPLQFLDKVLDMPVEVLRQVLGSMVQKTVVPQLPSIEGRRLSFRAAEADPHGPGFSADHGDSAVQLILVVDVPVVWSCSSSTCRGAEADPHGLVDHRDSPVAIRPGGRCPCFAGRASSTGAGCK